MHFNQTAQPRSRLVRLSFKTTSCEFDRISKLTAFSDVEPSKLLAKSIEGLMGHDVDSRAALCVHKLEFDAFSGSECVIGDDAIVG